MARVKFIRDKEPNIIALNKNKQAIDGAIYIATDTGKMWMGLAAGTLLEIKGEKPVVVDSSLSATSVNPVQNKVIKAALDGKAPSSHTHSIGQVSGLDNALAGKAPTNHTHNYAGSTSAGGAANTAIKLQNPRKISLNEGIESGAQSFDGSHDVTIPVRKIKESYLVWGGRDIHGEISPVDMAASSLHSANRFQFAKPAGITIEYSQNGTTFLPYSFSDDIKTRFVSGIPQSLVLGGSASQVTDTAKLRITLNASKMEVYTLLKKLLIEVSSNGASEFKVDIEVAKNGSETSFATVRTATLNGWTGWNSIFFDSPFGGGSSQSSNIGIIRLTFSQKKGSSQTKNAQVLQIAALGSTYWTTPSAMARTGHLYEWDGSQNATFPGAIAAKEFNGNASSASKVEWSGIQNKPVTFMPSSHSHNAANITSGVLSVDRVPSIPATKLTGIINQANLPSYVDDVLEFTNKAAFPTKGENGKIYIAQDTNRTYRWSGTAYVEISSSLALGTTSSTAFRGDYGNTAYQHAAAKGNAFNNGLYKITTNAQGHVTAATAVTKSDIVSLGIPSQDTNTWIAMKGATTTAAGVAGYVPAPTAGQNGKFLRGDGTWASPSASTYTAGSGLSLSGTTFSVTNKGITNAHLADKAVTSSKLDDSIGTIAVSSATPTDSHVKLWIKI